MRDICQICEENLPFIICLTCRDPRDISIDGEVSDGSGVMICKECFNFNHNRGFFLRHVTEDAVQHQQMHVKERLRNDVETLKKEALKKIDWKLSTFKNSSSKVKSREDACKRQVNQQLRVLYNRAVSMLTLKEEDMNKQISAMVEEFCSKKEKESEELKEFSSSLTSKFDKIMEMFDSEEFSEVEAHNWIGEAKQELEGRLVETDEFSCGPYFNINLDTLEEDAPLDINALKICDVNFRYAKELWKEDIMTAIQTKLEEGYEIEIKRPLKSMVSFPNLGFRLFIHIPHPVVIKHGCWIVDLLEAHLKEQNHRGNLQPIEDLNVPMSSGEIIGHVKYNLKSGLKEVSRCVLTSMRRLSNGGQEATLVYLDRERAKNSMDTKNILLVKLDEFSLKFPPLRLKLSFNNNKDIKRSYFPEVSGGCRKKLESKVDKGKVMKITFIQQIDLFSNPKDYLWATKLVIDDVSLNDLVEKGQAEASGKGSLGVSMCRDIRMLNNGGVGLTVVRGNAAAASDSSKEPSTNEKSSASTAADATKNTSDGSVSPVRLDKAKIHEIVKEIIINNAKNIPVVVDGKSSEEQDDEKEDSTTTTMSSSVEPSTTTMSSSLEPSTSTDYTEADINNLVESHITASSSTLPQDNQQLLKNQPLLPECYPMMGFVGPRGALLPTPLLGSEGGALMPTPLLGSEGGAGDHISQQQMWMKGQQQQLLSFFPPPQLPLAAPNSEMLTSQQLDEQLTACCIESINNNVSQFNVMSASEMEMLEKNSNGGGSGTFMNVVGNGDHSSNNGLIDNNTTTSSAQNEAEIQALMKIDTLSITSSDHQQQHHGGGERDQSPASSVSSAPSHFKPPPNLRRNSFRNNKQHRIGRGDSRGGDRFPRYSTRGRSWDDNSGGLKCWGCNRRGHRESVCPNKRNRRPSRHTKF